MPPAFALSQDQTLRFIRHASPAETKGGVTTNKPCLTQQASRSMMWSIIDQPHKRNCNASRIRDSHTHKSIKTRENRAHSQAPSPTDLNAQTILPKIGRAH